MATSKSVTTSLNPRRQSVRTPSRYTDWVAAPRRPETSPPAEIRCAAWCFVLTSCRVVYVNAVRPQHPQRDWTTNESHHHHPRRREGRARQRVGARLCHHAARDGTRTRLARPPTPPMSAITTPTASSMSRSPVGRASTTATAPVGSTTRRVCRRDGMTKVASLSIRGPSTPTPTTQALTSAGTTDRPHQARPSAFELGALLLPMGGGRRRRGQRNCLRGG